MGRLRAAIEDLDLAAWLEEYAEVKHTGGPEIKLRDCPECSDDRFKIYVNTDKKVWQCKVCDFGRGLGDVTRLMSAVSKRTQHDIRVELLKTTRPAIKGDIVPQLTALFDRDVVDEQETRDLTPVAVPGNTGFVSLSSKQVLNYALSRGLTTEQVHHLRLRAAAKLEFVRPDTTRSMVRGPWLVFPVFCNETPVAWQGRCTHKGTLSYLSSPNIKDWLWPLTDVFFDIYQPQASRTLVLVEGVFDALGMHLLGQAALCTFGKAISFSQVGIIQDLQPARVIFAWDADAYGELARSVDRIAFQFPETLVASMDYDADDKQDAGDALTTPGARPWVLRCLENAMDVRSSEFFQWRLEKV